MILNDQTLFTLMFVKKFSYVFLIIEKIIPELEDKLMKRNFYPIIEPRKNY
jgi:hypothetical protein